MFDVDQFYPWPNQNSDWRPRSSIVTAVSNGSLECLRRVHCTSCLQIDEANGKVITAFSSEQQCTLFWGASGPSSEVVNPTRIDLGDGSQRVQTLHLHPSGALAIVLMSPAPPGSASSRQKKGIAASAYLVALGQGKAAPLDGGSHFTACAWVPPSPAEQSQQSSGNSKATAVLGTIDGVLFSVAQRIASSSLSPTVAQLHRLPLAMRLTGRSTEAPVAAITAHRHCHDEEQLIVIALTDDPVQIMQFAGGSTVEQVFAASQVQAAPMLRPGADRRVGTQVHVYTPTTQLSSKSLLTLLGSTGSGPPPVLASRRGTPAPQHIAILTSDGLLYSRLDLTTPFQAAQYNFLRESKDLPYPSPSAALGTYAGPVREAEAALLPAATGAGGNTGTPGSPSEARGRDALGASVTPLDVRLTLYHIVYVFPTALVAVNRVSFEVVWTWKLGSDKAAMGGGGNIICCAAPSFVPDDGTGPLLATDQCAMRIGCEQEGGTMWKVFLSQARDREDKVEQLQLASTFAKEASDTSAVGQVQTALAKAYMQAGQYQAAAAAYARSNTRFEPAVIAVMQCGDKLALQAFLTEKLSQLQPHHKPQRVLLATWKLEVMLDRLSLLHASAQLSSSADAVDQAGDLLAEVQDFLCDAEESDDLHTATTYKLLSSRGHTDLFVFFAEQRGDLHLVAAHHAERGQWGLLLQLLAAAPPAKAEPLLYKHSAQLILFAPAETATVWKQSPFVDPVRLLPAMTRYIQAREAARPVAQQFAEQGDNTGAVELGSDTPSSLALDARGEQHMALLAAAQRKETPLQRAVAAATGVRWLHAQVWGESNCVVDYLQHVLLRRGGHSHASSLHSLLLQQYAVDGSDDELMHFVETALQRDIDCPLDIKYALRVCAQHGRKVACARLYSQMGLHEEAVRLALDCSVQLAQARIEQAREGAAPASEELLRRLWTIVVRHVLESPQDTSTKVAQALQLVQQSGVLTVEHVLPSLPDATEIDEVKAAIEASLQRSTRAIETLRDKMKTLTLGADKIGQEIRALRSRYAIVAADQRCALSGALVLGKPMFVFSTGNVYNADALTQFVVPHLPYQQQARVSELQSSIKTTERALDDARATDAASQEQDGSAEPTGKRVERLAATLQVLQAEFDEIIAADDPLCGDVVISTLQHNFGAAKGESPWCSMDWSVQA